jgi:ornithine decarboxylase
MLPELEIGDWLYYRNMGAYTTVTASTFNGFPVTQKYFTISEGTWLDFFIFTIFI